MRGKQALLENVPDVIRLEAMEMGPPQAFVWFTGLVALNGFFMDVMEAAELAASDAEYEAEAVAPSTLCPF